MITMATDVSLSSAKVFFQRTKDLISGYLKETKQLLPDDDKHVIIPEIIFAWCLLYKGSKYKWSHIVGDLSSYNNDPDYYYSDEEIMSMESDYFHIQDAKKWILPELLLKTDEFRKRSEKLWHLNLTPIELFKQTVSEYYDANKGENYYDKGYGFQTSMTRFIFIVWIFIMTFKRKRSDDKNVVDIVSQVEKQLNGEPGEIEYFSEDSDGGYIDRTIERSFINDGFNIVIHIQKVLDAEMCAEYDSDTYVFDNIWGIDIHDKRYKKIWENY
eukprot:152004_1